MEEAEVAKKTVESLTEKDNIKTVLSAIWYSTSKMMDEYRSDSKIGAEVFTNSSQAWKYAREKSYEIARDKTGRKLPED